MNTITTLNTEVLTFKYSQYVYDIRELFNDAFLTAIQKIKHDIDNRTDETIPYIVLCNPEQLKVRTFDAVLSRTVVLKHTLDIVQRCADHTYSPKYNTPEKAQAKKRERATLNGWVYNKIYNRNVHYVNGKIHMDGDEPAMIYDHGTKVWFKDGKKHRENDFAELYPDGTGVYWFNGRCYYDNEYEYKRKMLTSSLNPTQQLTDKTIDELVKLGYNLKISNNGKTIMLTVPKYPV